MSERTALAVRLYAAGLRLLPRETRDRFGQQMLLMFADGLGASSGLGRARVLVRGFGDLAWTVVVSASTESGRRRPLEPAEGFISDLRLATRSLLKRPGFTAVVVVTLALGVGANSAIFTLVNGLLLRPLPYEEPSELVQLSETFPEIGTMDISFPDFHHWRAETRVFTGMFAFDDASFILAGHDVPRLVEGAVVSPGFLSVLGVPLLLGRGFLEEDERPGSDASVIISEALWRNDLGGSPDVLERTLSLNGRARRIVGVVGAGFHFPEVAQLWVPLALDPVAADPQDYSYDVVARLGAGRTVQEARSEGARITSELAREYPEKAGIGADAYPLRAADVPRVFAYTTLVLLAAVSLVLLIACLNVANLLLARGEDRSGEMALRRALGASRWRLVRQVLSESLLLALAGSVGALLMANAAGSLFLGLLPEEVPFWLAFDLDWRVVAYTLGVTLLTCLAVGLPPGLKAARGAERTAAGSRAFDRGRQGLIVGQVALASMLVVSAGLMIRGLMHLQSVDPGLDPERVLVLSMVFPPWSYPTVAERAQVQEATLGSIAATGGVESVAAVASVPLLGAPDEVAVESAMPAQTLVATVNQVGDRYFAALRIPILEGRSATAEEVRREAPVVVVSESLAHALWPDGDALGRRLRHGVPGNRSPTVPTEQPWLEVIGVADDVRATSLGQAPRGMAYVPARPGASQILTVVVRTVGAPLDRVGTIRSRVAEVDPGVTFLAPTTMQEAMRFATWSERLASGLLSIFAVLALLLSMVGIYGVISLVTRRRANEIGVRRALGATRGSVIALVVGDSGRRVALGMGLGLVGGVLASRLLTSMLHGVRPTDPVTLLATSALLSLVALAASYIPARRVAGTDVVQALRSD